MLVNLYNKLKENCTIQNEHPTNNIYNVDVGDQASKRRRVYFPNLLLCQDNATDYASKTKFLFYIIFVFVNFYFIYFSLYLMPKPLSLQKYFIWR